MPFFFLAPIWLLLLIVGFALLISARFRFLSAYLILGSTIGFIASLILSTVLLLLMLRAGAPLLTVLVYLVSIGVGAVFGVFVGIVLARKLNRVLGWERLSS